MDLFNKLNATHPVVAVTNLVQSSGQTARLAKEKIKIVHLAASFRTCRQKPYPRLTPTQQFTSHLLKN